jgi:hypothetical protein
MSVGTVVGYSVNDFFYENPEYCVKTDTGIYSGEIKLTDTNENTNTGTLEDNTLCETNAKYGKALKEHTIDATGANARYQHSRIMYNRELLRSFNYVAGIGILIAYIYLNRK